MTKQNNWKEGEWINNFNTVFVKEGHLHGNHLELKDFISSLLSSQAHALKEQMKACVENIDIVNIDENTAEQFSHQLSMLEDGDSLKSNGAYFIRTAILLKSKIKQVLSAIESIEI